MAIIYSILVLTTAIKTAIGYSTNNWIMNLRYQLNSNVMGIPAHSHSSQPTLNELN